MLHRAKRHLISETVQRALLYAGVALLPAMINAQTVTYPAPSLPPGSPYSSVGGPPVSINGTQTLSGCMSNAQNHETVTYPISTQYYIQPPLTVGGDYIGGGGYGITFGEAGYWTPFAPNPSFANWLTVINGNSEGTGSYSPDAITSGTYPALPGSGVGEKENYLASISGTTVNEQWTGDIQEITAVAPGNTYTVHTTYTVSSTYDIATLTQTYTVAVSQTAIYSYGCIAGTEGGESDITAGGSTTYNWFGNPPQPTVTTKVLPPGQAYSQSSIGTAYSEQLTANGVAPFTWSVTGLPPGLAYTPSSGLIYGSITSDVPDTYNVTVAVSDSSGFVGQPAQVTLKLATYCGNPMADPAGDDRDTIINEYVNAKTPIVHVGPPPFAGSKYPYPHCDDFTESFQSLNTGSPKCAREFSYLLVQQQEPPNLLNWQLAIGATGPRKVNSAYRDPVVQACTGSAKYPAAKNSQHEHGDAVDLATLSKTNTGDYQLLNDTAIASGFSWTETYVKGVLPCQPNRGACVHGDMRFNQSPFVSP